MQRRPRPHPLELSLSVNDLIAAKDDDTPRRSHSVLNWSNITNRRCALLKYVAVACFCFLAVALPITRTLEISIFPKKMKTAAAVLPKPGIPYPPAEVHISVVIMNHARPNLLQHSALLPVLTHHPSVSEVLILHSNPATAFTNADLQQPQYAGDAANNHSGGKIRHVDASERNAAMGLAVRFHYCAEVATNDWVLHMDDDMELDASAVNELVLAMMENPKRIVGHYGRAYSYWRAPMRHGYDTTDLIGNVEVVLTKVLILEKRICSEFWKHAALMDDMVPDSLPLWNGEDIFVNLVANHHYGVRFRGPYNNYAISDLNVWEADTELYPEKVVATETDKKEVSVSGNMDRNRIWKVGPVAWGKAYIKAQSHTAYRGRLWYRAKRRLAGIKD